MFTTLLLFLRAQTYKSEEAGFVEEAFLEDDGSVCEHTLAGCVANASARPGELSLEFRPGAVDPLSARRVERTTDEAASLEHSLLASFTIKSNAAINAQKTIFPISNSAKNPVVSLSEFWRNFYTKSTAPEIALPITNYFRKPW